MRKEKELLTSFLKEHMPALSVSLSGELHELMEEFFKEGVRYESVLGLGRSFVSFLHTRAYRFEKDLPFLRELLVYEWTAVELIHLPSELESSEFSWQGRYRLSRSSKLLKFTYPVHKLLSLSASDVVQRKDTYYLLLYKGEKNKANSVQLTEFIFRILKGIVKGDTPQEALESVDMPMSKEEVIPYVEKFLEELSLLRVLVKKMP